MSLEYFVKAHGLVGLQGIHIVLNNKLKNGGESAILHPVPRKISIFCNRVPIP
jgi:hypothetical protein